MIPGTYALCRDGDREMGLATRESAHRMPRNYTRKLEYAGYDVFQDLYVHLSSLGR